MKPYYEDDAVTIYHGDCREVLPTVDLPGEAVVVTDPPYGIGWSRGENTRKRSSQAHAGIQGDNSTTARDAALALTSHLPAVVFGSFYAPPPDRVRQVLVWHKPADSGVVGSTTGYRRDAEPIFLLDPWPLRTWSWSSVLRCQGESISAHTRRTGHPHTKPLDLISTLIQRSPEGLVVDPFVGSGTTLRAAKDLGRKAIGIELDERYCEIAAKRMGQEVLDFGAA